MAASLLGKFYGAFCIALANAVRPGPTLVGVAEMASFHWPRRLSEVSEDDLPDRMLEGLDPLSREGQLVNAVALNNFWRGVEQHDVKELAGLRFMTRDEYREMVGELQFKLETEW